jgi:pyruvate dehydrogenase E1 component alpha subunit
LRTYLNTQGVWAKDNEEALLAECSASVEEATHAFLASTPQDIATIFDFTYAKLPADLETQRAEAIAAGKTSNA